MLHALILLNLALSLSLQGEFFPELDGSFSWAKGFTDSTDINWLVSSEVKPVIYDDYKHSLSLLFAVRSFVQDDPKGVIWQVDYLQYDIDLQYKYSVNRLDLFTGVLHQCRHNVDRWDTRSETWENYYLGVFKEQGNLRGSLLWGTYTDIHKADRKWRSDIQLEAIFIPMKRKPFAIKPMMGLEVLRAPYKLKTSPRFEIALSLITRAGYIEAFAGYYNQYELHECNGKRTEYELLGIRFVRGL